MWWIKLVVAKWFKSEKYIYEWISSLEQVLDEHILKQQQQRSKFLLRPPPTLKDSFSAIIGWGIFFSTYIFIVYIFCSKFSFFDSIINVFFCQNLNLWIHFPIFILLLLPVIGMSFDASKMSRDQTDFSAINAYVPFSQFDGSLPLQGS